MDYLKNIVKIKISYQMRGKISVKIENEQQFNVVMGILGGYMLWNPVMGEHPTAIIISNKDENGEKDKNYSKGSVGCAERQKRDGFKIISFSELELGSPINKNECQCQEIGAPVCYSCGYGCL